MRISSWTWTLGAACLLGLVGWQTVAAGRGAMALPDSVATTALSPLQIGLRAGGNYLTDVGHVIVRRDDLASENARLHQELEETRAQTARLLSLSRENEELRALLKMPNLPGGASLLAPVVSSETSPLSRRLTLGVGAGQGVQTRDVAYSAQGVVGQVTQVGELTCVVTLIIDREGALGARVGRSGAQGVVVGDGSRIARLDYLTYDADVRAGDTVLSSGLARDNGAVFPTGLVIGRVRSVEKNRVTSQQSATIEPAVPFESLSVVKVRLRGKS